MKTRGGERIGAEYAADSSTDGWGAHFIIYESSREKTCRSELKPADELGSERIQDTQSYICYTLYSYANATTEAESQHPQGAIRQTFY